MSNQCENCGQSVLDSDTTCWHCGWQLSSDNKSQGSGEGVSAMAEASAAFPWSLLLAYAGLTAVVFIALFAVMLLLGQRPLNLRPAPEPRWLTVSDRSLSFAVDLPPRWQWLDMTERRSEPEFQEILEENPQLLAAVAPFGEPAVELELLSMATDEMASDRRTSSFLLVTRDLRTKPLSVVGAIDRLRLEHDGVHLVDNLEADAAEEPEAEFRLEATGEYVEYRCLLKLHQGTGANYLNVACAEEVHFRTFVNEFRLMLNSFRELPG